MKGLNQHVSVSNKRGDWGGGGGGGGSRGGGEVRGMPIPT